EVAFDRPQDLRVVIHRDDDRVLHVTSRSLGRVRPCRPPIPAAVTGRRARELLRSRSLAGEPG
ncbi:MAG: hypothetical protein WCP53_14230, partial [Verrucomicrobiota bacterium]